MALERFKVKVSQSDADSTKTPFWSPRMIDILLAVYRWPLIIGGLVMVFLAGTWLGTVYWLVFVLLAFVALRREPVQWLRQRTAPLAKWWDHLL